MRYERMALCSDQLRDLLTDCPTCAMRAKGTGITCFDERSNRWFVDYWCPHERRVFSVWDPTRDELVQSIAAAMVSTLPKSVSR
jgi:hypothetical protein